MENEYNQRVTGKQDTFSLQNQKAYKPHCPTGLESRPGITPPISLQQFGGLKSRWRQLHPEIQSLQTFQRVIREQMNVKLRAKGRARETKKQSAQ